MGVLIVLAIATLSMLALADSGDYGLAGRGNVDVLGDGIFETNGAAVRFPSLQDTNVDDLQVGNDRALAIGGMINGKPLAVATNNLEVKKNQDSGACAPCSSCNDYCIKVNIDQIKVGNRNTLAIGSAVSTNNVKLVANQV